MNAANVIPAGYPLVARAGADREGYPVVGYNLHEGEAVVLDPGTGKTLRVSELDRFIGIEPLVPSHSFDWDGNPVVVL